MLQAWFLLMNGIFNFMVQKLGLGSTGDLLEYVVGHELCPTSLGFSEEECSFFREFDRRSGLELLTTEGYRSIPLTIYIIMSNYLIMTNLLSRLGEAAQIAFKSVCRYVLPDGSNPPHGFPMMKVGIVDSHFHLDLFSCRSINTLSDVERSVTSPVRLMV